MIAGEGLRARLLRIALWVGGTALVIFVLNLLGVPVADWIRELFKKVAEVPVWAVVAGVILQTAQTSLAALAWLGILRAAYPKATISFRLVLASYATAVALNSFLPANLGTWVMLVMFAAVIAGATFTAMLSAITVQKIPFSVFNLALYLYLFLTISGSFSIKLSFLADNPVLLGGIFVGVVFLLVIATRVFREHWQKIADELLTGGAIIRKPREFLLRVALPELGSFIAKLAIIAVFLAAYDIPATFHNVANVTASNSISNTVSVTPGGVGVTQAMNSAALSKETTAANATAYSVSQQVVISAWSVVFAVIMVSWVFGWSGGRELVAASYVDAREKSRQMKDKRAEKKQAKRR